MALAFSEFRRSLKKFSFGRFYYLVSQNFFGTTYELHLKSFAKYSYKQANLLVNVMKGGLFFNEIR